MTFSKPPLSKDDEFQYLKEATKNMKPQKQEDELFENPLPDQNHSLSVFRFLGSFRRFAKENPGKISGQNSVKRFLNYQKLKIKGF